MFFFYGDKKVAWYCIRYFSTNRLSSLTESSFCTKKYITMVCAQVLENAEDVVVRMIVVITMTMVRRVVVRVMMVVVVMVKRMRMAAVMVMLARMWR